MENLILYTDPGKYPDDENAFALAAALTRSGLINILAAVATLTPARQRARLTKGTFELVGLGHVPVGVGSDCGVPDTGQSDHEFAGISYLADDTQLVDGQRLVVETLSSTKVSPGSVTLLAIAGLTDPARLLRDHPDLFKSKIKRVVIMGGVETAPPNAVRRFLSRYIPRKFIPGYDRVRFDLSSRMVPDTASNNMMDPESSQYLYRTVQELGIPLTILSREAGNAAPVPRAHYDALAATGNPVGIKLLETQERIMQAVWERCNMAVDDRRREGLPARCDRQWFLDSYCGGGTTDRKPGEPVWDLVKHFGMPDPMSVMACVPQLVQRFFDPHIVKVSGVEHQVIGVAPSKRCVRSPKAVVAFLTSQIVAGLK